MSGSDTKPLSEAELDDLERELTAGRSVPASRSLRLVRDLRRAREILSAVDGAELYGYLPDAIEEDIRAFLGGPSAEAGHG